MIKMPHRLQPELNLLLDVIPEYIENLLSDIIPEYIENG